MIISTGTYQCHPFMTISRNCVLIETKRGSMSLSVPASTEPMDISFSTGRESPRVKR